MTNTDQIELGDEVKITGSGLTGIAVARAEFLNRRIQFSIALSVDKNGKPIQTMWFDQERIEVLRRGSLKSKPVMPKASTTGGERQDHPPR